MEVMARLRYLLPLAVFVQLGVCSAAFGQLLDEVDFRREGNNAIVRIHFGAPIQFQRSVAAKSGDLVQIYYNVLPGAESTQDIVGERRVIGGNGLPKMLVTDDAISRADPFKRRVLVQFETPTPYSVRVGRKRENIELVLDGIGDRVVAPGPARKAGDDGKNFLIVLQTSADSGEQLRASIPAAFQDSTVFTSRRVAEGKTLYDINLGYFESREEAAKALQLVKRRFPDAQVVGLKPQKIGESVPLPTPTLAVVAKNFLVLLQTSSNPEEQLKASIPAVLQESQVFTSSRTSGGQTLYDTNLGYFATREEAEKAQQLLVVRFPQASVVPAPGQPVVAAAQAAVTPGVNGPALQAVSASAPEIEAQAARLMELAHAANDSADYPKAIATLDELLNLPPNASTRKAQEQIGITRLKSGDRMRARAEFETFLKLYPAGTDSDQIRQYLQNLPPSVEAARERKGPEPVSVVSGSISTFYYGGESKTRSQDFAESPLGGTPVLLSENELSGQDQSQMQTNLDLNWRYRDTERDRRFVLRESYTSSFMANRPDRERLTALYYEQRNFSSGTSFKIGRQSPSGSGILYRFDGAQVGYRFAPKWKINATYGVPTDALLDAKRSFYGVSVDADTLTAHTSGTVYMNEQFIDDQTDRSAIGTELRYFRDGLIMSGQVDYDQLMQGLNVAALQGSMQFADNSVVNVLLDRRAVPVRSLGNVLFFQDPTLATPARSIRELLQTTPIDMLRSRVNGVTPFQSQASLGYNRPLNARWQVGGNLNYTNVDAIQPVPDILPNGQPSTGDLYGVGLQLIGSNLYSARDTHVFSLNYMSGPTYTGQMLAYNNMTGFEVWQLEPSLRYYTQSTSDGTKTDRWTPGVRMSYRAIKRVSLDAEVSYEIADTVGPTRKESATRMFYYLGGRFDF